MSFLDMIKKSVVDEFSSSLSTTDIFLSLIIAFISAIIITIIYKKTYVGVSYIKSFNLSIILLAMVTSLVIRTINSNLALSLGMVGALSIVRFRTAVKDPVDTIFMFWAITVGIMAGAGLYILTVIATLMLGIIYIFSYSINVKNNTKYLLIIKTKTSYMNKVIDMMQEINKCILKTGNYQKTKAELTFEITSKDIYNCVDNLRSKKEIEEVSFVNVDPS